MMKVTWKGSSLFLYRTQFVWIVADGLCLGSHWGIIIVQVWLGRICHLPSPPKVAPSHIGVTTVGLTPQNFLLRTGMPPFLSHSFITQWMQEGQDLTTPEALQHPSDTSCH